MSLATVNIATVALGARLDEAGFRHRATAVGERVGAARIGAGVYEAEAGFPIWPYHYHHGVEEWLYVISGAPVLRAPAGERTLKPGDLVCFPAGYEGAHTVSGPGRFVIFATGQLTGPYLSVYPDSDKISGPGGILLRSSAVGYWHGEGGASEQGEPTREPADAPPQRLVNVHEQAPHLRAERLAARVVELAPGDAADPYHYVFGQEEWALVLEGTLTVRHPHGEDRLEPGDVVCFPEGPAGARSVHNRSAAPARALLLSTTGLPANTYFPETGRWVLRNAPGDEQTLTS